MARRTVALVALVGLLGALAPACTSSSPSQQRAESVYAAVVRWFAGQHGGDDQLAVFIEPRGEGTEISLEVQAALVSDVVDVADVRFIDAREEALEEVELSTETTTEAGEQGSGVTVWQVRNGGVLIRIGPVIEDGDQVRMEVDRWVVDDSFTTLTFVVGQRAGEWVVIGDPAPTGTLDLES